MIPVKHVAIERDDGSVAIMQFVVGEGRKATPDAIAREIDRTGIKAKKWRIIDREDIPSDRTFRDAWSLSDSGIDHDMGKARDIHRDRMRTARAEMLAELDIAYIRADEAGDAAAKKDIVARKQKLRDVTKHPDIDKASTVDVLKAVWPDELK